MDRQHFAKTACVEIEGEGEVQCAFSADGRFFAVHEKPYRIFFDPEYGGEVDPEVYSRPVHIWNTDTWEKVITIPNLGDEDASWRDYVAFHPTMPLLVTPATEMTQTCIWKLNCL